ncbi:MAG TPA: C-terminal binding protein [Nocardioidaceae bacterium]|jgi:D-3-phosphoglycerate dehydrogenase
MKAAEEVSGSPAVLYLDMTGLDVEPGQALLTAAGIEVMAAADDPGPEAMDRVVALLTGYGEVTEDLLERLPALRLIATHSVGVDMVDIAAARARGVTVANVPASAVDEVAVHALALALALIRRIPAFDRDVRAGRWDRHTSPLPRVPGDMTCGVVGLGRIGRRFAEVAIPLFGRVVGFDPGVPTHAWPETVESLEWAELLSVSDCLSLHLPLTSETANMLDENALQRLPPGAVVINVSRGALVDEKALVAALESGHVSGVGLDVRSAEPVPAGDALSNRADVVSTPHVAYLSPGSVRRYAEVPARNVIAMLEGGRPLHPVD